MTTLQESPRRAQTLFISYSRQDVEFVRPLVDALKRRTFDAYIDEQDILPGEPWKERLGGLIATADSLVFVISPDAIASETCSWELSEAQRLKKKIVPVVFKRVPDADVPSALSRLNFVFM